MKLGSRIMERPAPPDQALLEQLKGLRSADVSNATQRLYSAGCEILPQSRARQVLGFAFTVKVPPGDNLFVLASLELALPGEVIVVDCGGDRSCAMLGELLAGHAAHRGISGFVIDGPVRDVAQLRTMDVAIFAAAVTNRGAGKSGPGEINVPVVCGRAAVSAGDVVVGDEDGVVFIPRSHALEVRAEVIRREAIERAFQEKIASGRFGERIDELMQKAGFGPDE